MLHDLLNVTFFLFFLNFHCSLLDLKSRNTEHNISYVKKINKKTYFIEPMK